MKKTIIQIVREELRKAEARGITRRQTARKCGLTVAKVSAFMAGKATIVKISTAQKLLVAIDRKLSVSRAR